MKSVKRKGESESLAVCRLKQTFRKFKMEVQLSDSDNEMPILLTSDAESTDGQESLPDPPEMMNGFNSSDGEAAVPEVVVYKDTALLPPSQPLAPLADSWWITTYTSRIEWPSGLTTEIGV